MINTVLFDLDGTLLPMDLNAFTTQYFQLIARKFAHSKQDANLILKGVMAGTKAMVNNDGTATNEEVFWSQFITTTGINKKDILEEFAAFYREEFMQLEKGVQQNKKMIKAVHLLKDKGYRLLLATNPLFPLEAIESRVQWSGLEISLFDHITSYEHYHACKPNIAYFKEVIKKNELSVKHCMMVGNDAQEDGIIECLDIPLYLIEDFLINREEGPLKSTWHSDSGAFLEFVKNLSVVK